jgi:hypothetical protein
VLHWAGKANTTVKREAKKKRKEVKGILQPKRRRPGKKEERH